MRILFTIFSLFFFKLPYSRWSLIMGVATYDEDAIFRFHSDDLLPNSRLSFSDHAMNFGIITL
ncbi:unnamed protein product [Moneuplotes crassus]|uniref:Uncharacterized protein n=1 Tax=Euplotes crassus TaxID=5936 RepID=A0AAD2D412_EUPCR|nr:unnamed protein product [Moneuplotes crassus]